MTTIKTNLRTTETDQDGRIFLNRTNRQAFNGVYNLGLIMGSQDKETHTLPVDYDQLTNLQSSLDDTLQTCLLGLAGIGGWIAVSELKLTPECNEWQGLGMVIQHLSLLAQETQSHIEVVNIQMEKANQLTKDEKHGH